MNDKILEIINKWQREESGAQYITGDIDECAKERLAKQLELVFAAQAQTLPAVNVNLEKPRRGRPPLNRVK